MDFSLNKIIHNTTKYLIVISLGVLFSCFSYVYTTHASEITFNEPRSIDLPDTANIWINVLPTMELQNNNNTRIKFCEEFGYTYVSHTTNTKSFSRNFSFSNTNQRWQRTGNTTTYTDTLTCDTGVTTPGDSPNLLNTSTCTLLYEDVCLKDVHPYIIFTVFPFELAKWLLVFYLLVWFFDLFVYTRKTW